MQIVDEVYGVVRSYAGPQGTISRQCPCFRRTLETLTLDACLVNGQALECFKHVDARVGIGFGKGDLTIFLRTPNPYWSSIIRAEIESIYGIREVFAVPCHWVARQGEGGAHRPKEDGGRLPETKRDLVFSFDSRLVVSFLLRLKHDTPAAPRLRQFRRPPVSGKRLNDVLNALFDVADDATGVYLSYDNHRILLQKAFRDWSEVATFQRKLSEFPGVGAVRSRPWLVVRSSEELAQWENARDPTPSEIPCNLLFDLSGPSDQAQIWLNRFREALIDSGIASGPAASTALLRPGFWSAFLHLNISNLRRLMYAVFAIALENQNVCATRTIPCMKLDIETPVGPAASPAHRSLPAYARCKYDGSVFFKGWQVTLPPGHHLRYQVYNWKYLTEWLTAYVYQMGLEWSTRFQLPRTLFFDRFSSEIRKETMGAIWALRTSPEEAQRCRIGSWAKISQFTSQVNAVQALFNEQLEGMQIAELAEPDLRLGERAGILPLMIAAVDRLMIQYMGYLSENSLGHATWFMIPRTWMGLSTTGSGHHLSVRPATLLLQLPMYVRIASADVLPLICHEASHVIFDHLFPFPSSEKCLQGDIDSGGPAHPLPIKRTFFDIYREFTSAMLADMPTSVRAVRSQGHRSIGNILKELYVDIMAGFIGSPGFFTCFGRNYFKPSPAFDLKSRSPFPERQRIRPLTRLRIGQILADALGWADPWKKPIDDMVGSLEYVNEKYKLDFAAIGPPTTNSLVAFWLEEQLDDHIDDTIGGALRDTALLPRLREFLTDNFEEGASPLFFPYHGTDDEVESKATHKRCVAIAKGMASRNELSTDVLPRDIVAALEVHEVASGGVLEKVLKRPTLNTGCIWLSLIYGLESKAEEYSERMDS